MTTGQRQARYVYLFESNGIYKIGSSRNPARRLCDVAPGGRLIHHFPSRNAFRVERAIQRHFDPCLVRSLGREWFSLTQEDVSLICSLGRTDTADELPGALRPSDATLNHAERRPGRRARLVLSLDPIVKHAVELRLVKNAGYSSLSDVVNSILRDEYSREIAELSEAPPCPTAPGPPPASR